MNLLLNWIVNWLTFLIQYCIKNLKQLKTLKNINFQSVICTFRLKAFLLVVFRRFKTLLHIIYINAYLTRVIWLNTKY